MKSLLTYNSSIVTTSDAYFSTLGFETSPKVLWLQKPIISNPFRCPWSEFRPWSAISLIRCPSALKPIPVDTATSS